MLLALVIIIACCISPLSNTRHSIVRNANVVIENNLHIALSRNSTTNCQFLFSRTCYTDLGTFRYVIYNSYFLGSLHCHSETDVIVIFCSTEKHKLFFPGKTYGLSTSGICHLRSVSVLMYACMVCIQYISYFFNLLLLKHRLRCMEKLSSGAIIRKARQCIATCRHKALLNLAVVVLLSLLLCGDIHPNPGPVLPGSTRHSHL